jgi:hypothetical protein
MTEAGRDISTARRWPVAEAPARGVAQLAPTRIDTRAPNFATCRSRHPNNRASHPPTNGARGRGPTTAHGQPPRHGAPRRRSEDPASGAATPTRGCHLTQRDSLRVLTPTQSRPSGPLRRRRRAESPNSLPLGSNVRAELRKVSSVPMTTTAPSADRSGGAIRQLVAQLRLENDATPKDDSASFRTLGCELHSPWYVLVTTTMYLVRRSSL